MTGCRRACLACFGSAGSCSKALLDRIIGSRVPGSELLEAFLPVRVTRKAGASSAEAVDGARGCKESWDGVDGVGAARSQAAEAIGSKEGGRLSARSDAQQ